MPYADSADLLLLLPDITEARAVELLDLSTMVIDSYITEAIPDPTPQRVQLAAIITAAQLAGVDSSGQVLVGETIGGYSYQALAAHPGGALTLTDDVKALLAPWGPSAFGDSNIAWNTLEGDGGLWV